MAEYRPIEEDVLIALARGGGPELSDEQLGDMAAEVLRHRRADRLDSRIATQVKKMRWAVENLLKKTEDLEKGEDLGTEPPWLEDAARALGELGPDGKPLAMGWQALIRRIESQRLRLEATRAFAQAYGRHLDSCGIKRTGSGMCTCGYADAIAKAITAADGPR